MRYCTRCVYPESCAHHLTFDENGVCSGCRVQELAETIDWAEREQALSTLLDEYRTDGSEYDCIIPVSGGKDSYYQAHLMTKVYGLKALLVTFKPMSMLPEALGNLERMKDCFDADHIVFEVNTDVLRKLHRLGMTRTGDPTWYYHCGIATFPVQVAVKYKIPLIIWGEHGFTYRGGMFSLNDMAEMTAKYRLEHTQRGFDWSDFVEETEGLTERDLLWATYPTDEELDTVGVRGIYINFFLPWEQYSHTKLMQELYGWEPARQPFDRTYRMIGGLDDYHEIGIHDYMKFVKFGYGRCTDDACLDIRSGHMTREQAVELVRKHDHVKPSDTQKWLDFVGWTEEQLDEAADAFRDSRVWRIEDGQWVKDDLWGGSSAYGPARSAVGTTSA